MRFYHIICESYVFMFLSDNSAEKNGCGIEHGFSLYSLTCFDLYAAAVEKLYNCIAPIKTNCCVFCCVCL